MHLFTNDASSGLEQVLLPLCARSNHGSYIFIAISLELPSTVPCSSFKDLIRSLLLFGELVYFELLQFLCLESSLPCQLI